jgi:hypothetical protein
LQKGFGFGAVKKRTAYLLLLLKNGQQKLNGNFFKTKRRKKLTDSFKRTGLKFNSKDDRPHVDPNSTRHFSCFPTY